VAQFRNTSGYPLPFPPLRRDIGPGEVFDWPDYDPDVHGAVTGVEPHVDDDAQAYAPEGDKPPATTPGRLAAVAATQPTTAPATAPKPAASEE
jgi:hypothetical protein